MVQVRRAGHHRISPESTVAFSTRYTKKHDVIATKGIFWRQSDTRENRLRNKQSSTTSPVAASAPVTSAKGPIAPPANMGTNSVRSSNDPQKATTTNVRIDDVSISSSSSSSSSSSPESFASRSTSSSVSCSGDAVGFSSEPSAPTARGGESSEPSERPSSISTPLTSSSSSIDFLEGKGFFSDVGVCS